MSTTTADYILQRLSEWGVERVFGFPGDGLYGLLRALERSRDRLQFVQVRHQEMAAFMACGHAKWTGDVGVCCATSGPGAIHLLNGLYDARLDHQPVVAVVGQTSLRAMGGQDRKDVDLIGLFKEVASAYVQQADSPEAVRHVIDRAVRIARAERTVTCAIVPADVQEMDAVCEQPRATHTIRSAIGWSEPRVVPRFADLRRAADLLNAGRRVAILVGAGALHATDEVVAVADTLGAGIAKALLGKAAVPDDVPFCTNAIGLLGTKPSWDLMQGCDTLLLVGTSFPYSEFLPREGQARTVQIDIQGRMQGLRYPVDVLLTGDARETLRELLPLLSRKDDRGWQERIARAMDDWWRLMDEQGRPRLTPGGKLNPQSLFAELSSRLPEDAILASDSGSAASWYARHIRVRRGMKASLSGNLATMLPAVPYAIAAKFAFPERTAFALVGDGAMQMLGMNELLTAARYYPTWSNPRLVVLVLNNQDLNQVTWEQRVLAGDPTFDGSHAIPAFDFARYAESIGLRGIRVERPEDVEPAWAEALVANRPVVVDAVVDPEELPLPPHVTFDQAKKFARSLVGEPYRGQLLRESIRDRVEELLPRR
jgi:pyruvate dehydrogenase (quinone)